MWVCDNEFTQLQISQVMVMAEVEKIFLDPRLESSQSQFVTITILTWNHNRHSMKRACFTAMKIQISSQFAASRMICWRKKLHGASNDSFRHTEVDDFVGPAPMSMNSGEMIGCGLLGKTCTHLIFVIIWSLQLHKWCSARRFFLWSPPDDNYDILNKLCTASDQQCLCRSCYFYSASRNCNNRNILLKV